MRFNLNPFRKYSRSLQMLFFFLCTILTFVVIVKVFPGHETIRALFIASLPGVFTAILGDLLRRLPSDSTLKLLKQVNVPQAYSNGKTSIHVRLPVKNIGTQRATFVRANIDEIIDPDGKARFGFIPLPLCWTHGQVEQNQLARDINPNEMAYLDIIEFKHDGGMSPVVPILRTAAGNEVVNFQKLEFGKTKLKISLYQESGQVLSKTIEFEIFPQDISK